VTNAVDIRIGLTMSDLDLTDMLYPHPESRHKFRMPFNGKLPLGQTVPISEIKRPTMLDRDGEPCLIVGKRGKSTGITWGCGNELKSCVRNGKNKRDSMEWCVVCGIDKAFVPFSEPGDSGSAVFDVAGRVAGILTGGTGWEWESASDITYVTPMAWIQEDMKKYGYSVEIA
jgi:hypothetical protein